MTLHRAGVPRQVAIVLALVAVLVAEGAILLAYVTRGPEALGVWASVATLQATGIVLPVLGVAVVSVAERQMGTSYRFGIDDRPTQLVQHGLFAILRNPIYTGVLVILGGLALAVPCLWTALGWVAAALGFGLQARLEERHLLAMHGDAYRRYASRTGRFLPGIGFLEAPRTEVS